MEKKEVDGAEVYALLIALGLAAYGHKVCSERLVDELGEKPDLTEIIRTAQEALENVEKLIEMLFDFNASTDDENG